MKYDRRIACVSFLLVFSVAFITPLEPHSPDYSACRLWLPLVAGGGSKAVAVNIPTIDPNAGAFDYAVFVELLTTTPGAAIYYTLDGTDPDATDTLYTGRFSLTATANVKAIGIIAGDADSPIASANLTINAPPARHDVSNGSYIEAAGAQTLDDWLLRSDPQAVNNLYLVGLDDDEDGNDEYFDVDITCQETGTYYVWLRCRASMYAQVQIRLDAGAWTTVTAASTDAIFRGWGWHWREVGLTYSLTASANYTFRIRRLVVGTYSAPAVDRLFFTTSGAAEPPQLELIHPNCGERWPLGIDQEITWQSSGDIANVEIEVSYDSGETWANVVASTANDGSYTWTGVPGGATANCRIRISDPTDAKISDESDGDFCIAVDTNPFDTSILMDTKLKRPVGLEPWDQGDRATYLADLEDEGDLQREFAFPAVFNLGGGVDDHEPDTEAITAFRSGNDNVTKLIAYNNLFSISGPTGEAMMGDISAHPDWFLYDASSNRVENPINGRDCFDFRNTDFLAYLRNRIIMYVDAGIDGVFLDSFDVLRKRIFENGYWHETYLGGVYSDDINVVNPRTGATYTTEDWIADLRYAVSWLRREIDEHYDSRDVIFIANGLYPEHVVECGDIVDGFYREGYAGPANNVDTLANWWFNRNLFELTVNGLIAGDAADKSWLILQSGRVSGAPWTQSADQGWLYYTASALLAISGPDTGIYIDHVWHPAAWDGWGNLRLARFVPEGRYFETGDDVFRRKFQHAVVYVNPTQINQGGIALGDDYYYMQDDGTWSAATIDTLDLDAGRGAILVIDKDWEGNGTTTSTSTLSTTSTSTLSTTSTSTTTLYNPYAGALIVDCATGKQVTESLTNAEIIERNAIAAAAQGL